MIVKTQKSGLEENAFKVGFENNRVDFLGNELEYLELVAGAQTSEIEKERLLVVAEVVHHSFGAERTC